MLLSARRFRWFCAVVALLARVCFAQVAPQPENASTLHVYVNLVQIPVLVLNPWMRPMPRMADSQFQVTIEGFGAVKPTHIRLEGDDPIGLALVVDRSDQDEKLWNNLPKSLDPLLKALRPHDEVLVLGTDGCIARRFGPELAPFHEAVLRDAVERVTEMKAYSTHRKESGSCAKPLSYWDLLLYAADQLSRFSGRKIVVSVGASGGAPSQAFSKQLRAILNSSSISLFPILHGTIDAGPGLPFGGARQINSGSQARDMALVNPGGGEIPVGEISLQAELSGGMLIAAGYHDLAKRLAEPVLLARGRYILEFPRPDKLDAGAHILQVADGHPRDFIRPAGISVPVAEPKEMPDPSVKHGKFVETPPDAASDDHAAAVAAADAVSAKPADAAPTAEPAATAARAPRAISPQRIPEPDPTDITNDLRPSH